jgi:hypothetical protein
MDRKPFLLRLDPQVADLLRAWAGDDLRSLNGQIEFLLRAALRDAGRLTVPAGQPMQADRTSVDQRSVLVRRSRSEVGGALEPTAPAGRGGRRRTVGDPTDG